MSNLCVCFSCKMNFAYRFFSVFIISHFEHFRYNLFQIFYSNLQIPQSRITMAYSGILENRLDKKISKIIANIPHSSLIHILISNEREYTKASKAGEHFFFAFLIKKKTNFSVTLNNYYNIVGEFASDFSQFLNNGAMAIFFTFNGNILHR